MVAVLLPATARAQQAPTIQWELVNPFRFIHDQETVDRLKQAYEELPSDDKSAFRLERKLQDQSEAEIRKRRSEAINCDRPNSAEEKRKCFEPYAGWLASVAQNNHARTCWDSKNFEFRTDGPCENYINPTSHRVRVWIANPESLGNVAPQWRVQPALDFAPCHSKYRKQFCIEFDIRYVAQNPQQVQVMAQTPDGTLTINNPIQVFDKLIVGLGDSFAAGEGNPDIPAEFIDSDKNRDSDPLAKWLAGHDETRKYPRKDEKNEAKWLDWRCHRSMYSYQFKTALQLALSYPRAAITYVTFSCSGAVTGQIINQDQKPNERRRPKGKDLKPQLQALHKALRDGKPTPREIDFLLLSTGGNDVGFANYVAYILLRQKLLLRGLDLVKDVSEKKMAEGFRDKKFEGELLGTAARPGNYAKLQKALFEPPLADKPTWMTIKDCKAGEPCKRILLTPYPDLLTDENGAPCRADRLEFDETFGTDNRRAAKIETVRAFVFEQIKAVQAQVTARFGWTLINGNVAAYFKHGFCSRNAQSPAIGERFQLPTWLNEEWLQFDPRDYPAFTSRFRWFRLPVDSKLTTDQHTRFLGVTFDAVLEDVRSNIMHPTAEGLARTADLNVEEIRKIEPLPIPQ